ncbi:TrmH family RNA methyltransferase [Paenarthrobacter aurescens]|uniref:rRNA methyltransferase n=1 Tax=Paenarthrobacter aurescens TaxID=43663 RepID=A0A4Y3NM82_PAEAU|nr:RNA methyltransferase [Paenarthrobacter aurescens]UKA51828.1 RNA methyltransferase [Arthrobacter sp. FW305-123]MDO6143575.1 RNA methyltransferase [Paenarthrobacter aurescens]MDO6147423.1 RNA methyltransferase [Paenarthrobacter aurescens]MDO6158667.1 RNA methyltransferase [Paenarthrobacter aurescens]MDO6162650.1 RNA methyltransferase [Paenarthrobacter aurescens]
MTFHYLESANDPRVTDYTTLTDVHLRKLREPREGMYIAESSKVLRRALAAGHQPRSFFLAEKWLEDLDDVFKAHPDVPVFIGKASLLEEITGFHLHRGAMAAMHRPAPVPLTDLLINARRIAVLEDIVDHTNVGAIFRSAAALGVDAVLVSPRCGDPLYRRSVRVSMGTVFQIPWARLDSWPAGLASLQEQGFTVAAMELTDDALNLDELAAKNYPKLALVLGTEGAGMSEETLAAVDLAVKIPMRAGVDSLNVAAASAVAFWELRPQE